jgi:hypothetical protein
MDKADRINELVEKVEELHGLADHVKDVVQGALQDYLQDVEDLANELEELAGEDPGEDGEDGDRELPDEAARVACRDLANGLRDLAADDTIDRLADRASEFVQDEVDDLQKRANVLIDIASVL